MVAMSVEQHPLPEGARQRFIDRLAICLRPQRLLKSFPSAVSRQSVVPLFFIPWSIAAVMALVAVLLGLANNSVSTSLPKTTI